MHDFKTGDLVAIQKLPTGFSEFKGLKGTILSIRQQYWDYGDGECGFVDIADILTDNQIVDVALTFLVPV
jgi:hypothetical protein